MKSNARLGWLIALLLAAGALPMAAAPALAADQISWVADFQAACGMAAEQHRLVLLHFYNDNCGPCVRLEQNVFSQPDVAEAVSQNYLAVKVHAGKSPQLASRYRVQQWPTDVIVTPSGLEVFRTISPQRQEDYVAMLNQVAQQSGVGTARQWKNQMGQTLAAAADSAKTAADDAQKRAEESYRQANNAIQQSTAAGTRQWSQWSQQANDAVQHYEQQAGDAYRQFRQQAGEVGHQAQQQAGEVAQPAQRQSGQLAQQVQQQSETTKSRWLATTQKATEDVAQTANELKDQMHQATQTLLDRRSAFVSPESSPAAQPAAGSQTNSPAGNPVASHAHNASSPPAAGQTSSASASPAPADKPAPAVTTNPWVVANQASTAADTTQARSGWSPAGPGEPPFVPAQPQPTAPPPEPSFPNHQMIPVSQAPPIALDGFCPVTLREVFDHNPADRSAWRKGDRRFGAIHNGRTFLFASAEQQQKFLANPDAYAPVLSGCDPVLFAERGQMVDGKRAYGLVTPDRQVYLFADEATLNRFKQAPGNYAGAIQQAKARADAGNLYR